MIVSRLRWCIAGAVLASLALVAAGQRPALAHSILTESHPAARGSVLPGETSIALRYNNRIDRSRSRLSLIHPDRRQEILPLDSSTAEDALAASAVLAPGAHVLRWQVLSIDGHIVRGEVPFTVRAR